ncbi:uncharacterized protein EAE97_011497 [Botrytis byssoidea]|uniref:Azaphilone pigments biosynthesis cluster protein L N-terminal domain-containing protein n=1 Tax=Botrytis byssoidea TaxID=139641 RepID=A0A9P5HWD3_9HELO|nr:uncharacterized protein EAE97_011497 [Botrytis byssoidea]KAF7920156.1 hypothetical protein EAE97_011497 [Botrytis byssoidea]
MDPLSISTSVLTVIAATIATIKTLNETVGRYKGRDKTLARLQGGLNDLISILESLKKAATDDSPILALLKGPVSRCAQVSREFEAAMKTFDTKSKLGLKDWAKMEFMRGDINEFIDTLADYKSTITIGLGTVNMHTSRLTQQVFEEYGEMVKDTAYNLEIRLQRIDEKMAVLSSCHPTLLEDPSIDLQDEKAVTVQCLRICERATSYIQSLQDEQPTLQRESLGKNAGDILRQFEAQLLTQKTLTENRDKLAETICRLQEHLNSVAFNRDDDRKNDTLQLKEEIEFSKQCLEVCKEATNQVSAQKIHVIGEVVADGDCDQVVVTAIADLFHVGAVKAQGRSMQMVGSMPADTLREMSKDRYSSRFGALDGKLAIAQSLATSKTNSSIMQTGQSGEEADLASTRRMYNRPSSNEIRKRRAEGEDGMK